MRGKVTEFLSSRLDGISHCDLELTSFIGDGWGHGVAQVGSWLHMHEAEVGEERNINVHVLEISAEPFGQ